MTQLFSYKSLLEKHVVFAVFKRIEFFCAPFLISVSFTS